MGLGIILASRQIKATTVFALGWSIGAGWLVYRIDYLAYCRHAQELAYTFPVAHGLADNFKRSIECIYYAATTWLPLVLLLPYWILLSMGHLHLVRAPGRPNLHVLLLGIIIPSMTAVTLSIMHKRTGSFLLPAAAIWIALGSDMLIRRLGEGSRTRLLVALLILILFTADVGRALYEMRKNPNTHDPASLVVASILQNTEADAAPIWAFGAESEVYTFWEQPIFYPFRSQNEQYGSIYKKNAGRPRDFVQTLRKKGVRYIAFTLRKVSEDQSPYEHQLYEGFSTLRADLVSIRDEAADLNLRLLGSSPANGGKTEVYVFDFGVDCAK